MEKYEMGLFSDVMRCHNLTELNMAASDIRNILVWASAIYIRCCCSHSFSVLWNITYCILCCDYYLELVSYIRCQKYLCGLVDPLFVQPVFIQPVFVQPCFRPTLDLSNSLSSMTYIRPICFRPILVHFLFLSKKTEAKFHPIFRVFST